MKIAIHTASAPVRRALESVVSTAGHQLTSLDEAELLLQDTLHPGDAKLPALPTLRLVSANASATEENLPCPIRPEALIQRLTMRPRTPSLPLGNGWSLDATARQLSHSENSTLSLTEKESSLLHTLANTHPTAITRETLLNEVWGVGSEMDTHTLETHIYRLRGKLAGLTPPAGDILTQNGAYLLDFTADHR